MTNTTKIILITMTIVGAACNSSKKSTTSTTTPAPTTNSTSNFVMVKSSDGINIPSDEDLKAIQSKYADATMEQLKLGHSIYTQGACINCHNANSIYNIEEAKWKDLLDDMAQKANISDSDKDAVYKYVLAMKAGQPK